MRFQWWVVARTVCNNFHLFGTCDADDRCEYDHSPLEEETLPALQSLAHSQPCPQRGGCRTETCFHGHICQNLECKNRGGKVFCKIPYLAHLEPMSVARYTRAFRSSARSPTAAVKAAPPAVRALRTYPLRRYKTWSIVKSCWSIRCGSSRTCRRPRVMPAKVKDVCRLHKTLGSCKIV